MIAVEQVIYVVLILALAPLQLYVCVRVVDTLINLNHEPKYPKGDEINHNHQVKDGMKAHDISNIPRYKGRN